VTRNPQLEALSALAGEWALEAAHPAFPSTVVRGHATVEWLEGEKFLIHRSRTDHPEFPDSIAIIGAEGESLAMHYFDSRGVQRVYGASLSDGVWRMWRDEPGFSQRFTGELGDGDETISGLWKLSRDGSTWDDDLEITYRRLS
jgi:hypothetical protein